MLPFISECFISANAVYLFKFQELSGLNMFYYCLFGVAKKEGGLSYSMLISLCQ